MSAGPDVRRPAGAAPEALRHTCAGAEIPFASTAQAEPDAGVFGQLRAFEALEVALSIGTDGYNVFATGPAGTGRRTMLADWLRERAAARPAPPDVVYVRNFEDPLRPYALSLPTGSGRALQADVAALVDDARHGLASAFESDSYRARHRDLHDEVEGRRAEVLGGLEQQASKLGVAIQLTPAGVITVPIAGGRALTPDEVRGMPDAARERFEASLDELKGPVDEAFLAMRDLDRELGERHRALNREVAVFAIGHFVEAVQRRWAHVPRIVEWLDALREDAIDNLGLFRGDEEREGHGAPTAPQRPLQVAGAAGFLARYAVNVLVTHDPTAGAPVVVATDPSFYDLFGRVEYETTFGAAVTDHRHLRGGLLHEAAGGFLVLQAADLLAKPLAWPRLKDVLRTGRLKIDNVAVQYMLFPGVSLDPEPVEVHVCVVLVGSTELYQFLHALDEDLSRLFKLRADFDDQMPRDEAGVRAYAGLLARVARERGLPDFDRGAIAAVVEHGGRLAGHRDRLSTGMRVLGDVATEAAYAASGAGADAVGAEHVAAALRARRRRADIVEERIRESTLEGTVRIDVDGAVCGQVNGLAVALLGDHEFGHPVRITATVAPGEGEVVDIDREARLSGPVHAKGVLILSGYLAGRYFLDRPMTLRASIVFEQSYGPVEGDSASTAELLALLSALAGLPVAQGIAVTGAVDQHGAVHAVGGINEKVEGFHDLCAARGLTGDQGVIVPAANLPHLMLDERVVAAVRDGRFSVWPVHTVDEALALICGRDDADALVRDRLLALSRAAQEARSIHLDAGPPQDGPA
ncbi:MAG: Lon protease family protein [Solirubrobacteraceae bacterium]